MKDSKILLITGSLPPDICGVGDYTSKLLNNFQKNQIGEISLFYRKDWSLFRLFNYLLDTYRTAPSIIHLQYPTEGYGYSILPLLLILLQFKAKTIVTIHEFSSRTFKAKFFTYLIMKFSDEVVVTNQFEFNCISSLPFISKQRIKIINIGSNIDMSPNANRLLFDRKIDLAYFGHIRPNKGLEDFLAVSEHIIASNPKLRIQIIGQKVKNYERYFDEIVEKATKLNIELMLNQDEDLTSSNLSDCKIVYLPFLDGISSRRGSFIASAINGCQIITTPSKDLLTNEYFESYCFLVASKTSAIKEILNLINGITKPKEISLLRDHFTWDKIILKHKDLYQKVCK